MVAERFFVAPGVAEILGFRGTCRRVDAVGLAQCMVSSTAYR
jgi:hypothetical protein